MEPSVVARAARRVLLVALTVSVSLGVPGLIWGQVGATAFGVGATVLRRCDISTTPLAFGEYDPLVRHASQPLDRDGSVTITCTKGTSATVGLNDGSHASGTVRNLSNGSALLRYDLFIDAARTRRWGMDEANALQAGDAPSDAPRTFVVFGRIFAGQDVPVGAYTDLVVVTVDF
jgi:spore coat protein U-like protein